MKVFYLSTYLRLKFEGYTYYGCFEKIHSFQSYDKLLEANLTYLDILTRGEIYLSEVTELTVEESKHLIAQAVKQCLKTTLQPLTNVQDWIRFTTGCKGIDQIIRGGIPVNGLTEIVGPSGVGKTQFCLQLAITVQLPVTSGGMHKGALYICTEDLFPSKRLQQLSNAYTNKYREHNFMDNIFVEHISDYEQLRRCCTIRLPKLLKTHKIGLIVIDSIAAVFRSENVNVNYATRSQQFCIITSTLTNICNNYGVSVVTTNQVIDNLETGKSEPSLGLAWSNLVTCRFWINRFSGSVRVFEIMFAPDLPNRNCKFVIEEAGLVEWNF
ncbi:hypothetical protein FQR65_LT06665 [Abscondita terminalis]|nr:hypothetical protein FQR65_LT06665 [Abscondita terminalis]